MVIAKVQINVILEEEKDILILFILGKSNQAGGNAEVPGWLRSE
jgi:hypothetical protein